MSTTYATKGAALDTGVLCLGHIGSQKRREIVQGLKSEPVPTEFDLPSYRTSEAYRAQNINGKEAIIIVGETRGRYELWVKHPFMDNPVNH